MEKFRNQFKKNIQFLSPNALIVLQNYDWPGNIRELENVLERAFVVGSSDVIRVDCLPERLWLAKKLIKPEENHNINQTLKETEKTIIENVLKKHNGHRGETAKELNMDRTTLWRKLKKYTLI